MRLISLLAALAGLAEGAQVIGSGFMSNGKVRFHYETRIEPVIAGQNTGSFGSGAYADDGLHRYLFDSNTKRYFGYQVSAAPEEDGAAVVTFQPFSVPIEKISLKPEGGPWVQVPLPKLPPPQSVRSGETIAIDLMVNPVTAQKIVDYLTVTTDRRTFTILKGGERHKIPAADYGQPRDFRVEDAVLRLDRPVVKVNGDRKGEWGGGISGPAVWLYVAGHGRFVMSLAPHTALGFTKMGEVRADTLTIRNGSDAVQIFCQTDIAGDAAYNLYVHHDPAWRPRGAEASEKFLVGAADEASRLVRR